MREDSKSDFIRDLVVADNASGRFGGRVCTRFPPEPNGFLHIGHAKSICLNFGIARDFGGVCHLRMDDTNPTTEDPKYVEAIQRDVRWLGFDWGDKMFYASDRYDWLYELAEGLIQKGRAYVCDLSEDEFDKYRGSITEPGKPSPYRQRSVEENLDRFRRMKKGEFEDGKCVLRAKIDMASPNMKMRDPPLYRIKHAHHYRTGDTWCIYPLYDYAHCLCDSWEGITHSICTLEFESARELYDWVLVATEVKNRPYQTEFARLNLNYTVMSKRKFIELVEGKYVAGWDDPRMPTLAGMRRRGYTPEAIRAFCGKVGVARNLSVVDIALLEHTVREDLNARSPRVLAVLDPLPLTIENYPDGEVEELDAPYWPHDVPKEGSRKLPFEKHLYIDRSDFLEEPPKDFHRLSPGKEVRLRHAYVVRCTGVDKDQSGKVVGVRCAYDPATRGGQTSGKKVEGTIQWVSERHALDIEVRLYDRLFTRETPGEGGRDFKEDLNPDSLKKVRAKVEPSLSGAKHGDRFQFERVGFFYADDDSKPGAPVFNRTVALKDSWAKASKAEPQKPKAENKRQETAPQKASATAELDPEAAALKDRFSITADEARVLAEDAALFALFEGATKAGASAKAAASFVTNEVTGELRAKKLDAPPFAGDALAELLALIGDGTISNKLAKDVLAEMIASKQRPKAIVEARGYKQISDASALEDIVDQVLAKNADAVARFKAGNANVLGALVGIAMKESGGRANPKMLTEVLKKKLG